MSEVPKYEYVFEQATKESTNEIKGQLKSYEKCIREEIELISSVCHPKLQIMEYP